MWSLRRSIATAALGGAAVWGISGVDQTTRDDSGQIVEAGDLGIFVTQVGDCFNVTDPNSTLLDVTQGVPCSEPHNWQVFYKGDLALSVYDQEEIRAQSNRICEAALERLLNQIDYEDYVNYQDAIVQTVTPTVKSFANGDEMVDCIVGNSRSTYTTSLLD